MSGTSSKKGMPSLLRHLFLFYFASHIPITVLIDAQGVFPSLYSQPLNDLLAWHVTTFGDFLMGNPPDWFQHIVLAEIFLQLPFFFVATCGFLYGKNWLRLPCLIYGSHTATTLIPILGAFATSTKITSEQKTTLFAIYSPYLIVPLLLIAVMLAYEEPFAPAAAIHIPHGHSSVNGGDVSKCPFASMMGISNNTSTGAAAAATGAMGANKQD